MGIAEYWRFSRSQMYRTNTHLHFFNTQNRVVFMHLRGKEPRGISTAQSNL